MRFVTDLGRLAESARDASAGLPSNPLHPVLAGMLIKAEKNVTLTSFDGNVMFTAQHDDPGHCEGGTAVVPGRLFTDIIRNLPGDTIEFHVRNGKAHINAGNVKFTLPTLDIETYPGALTPAPTRGEAEGPALADAIAKVAPSVSKIQANPAFTCILAEPDGDSLALVASDRTRMACARVPWTQEEGPPGPALIPGWAAGKFGKALTGKVMLGWDSRCFNMACKGLAVVSRGITQEHLPWRDMLPDSVEGITVDAPALEAAIRQVSLVLSPVEPVELAFEGDDLHVTGTSSYGECVNYLPVRNPQGLTIKVKLGVGIILDGLAGCGEQAVLGFSGPGKPVKLYSETFRYLMACRRDVP